MTVAGPGTGARDKYKQENLAAVNCPAGGAVR